MKKVFKAFVLSLVLMLTTVYSRPAFALYEQGKEPSGAVIMVDVLLVRPLGIASTVLGTGVFIVGLPFTIPTGTVSLAAEKLVAEPFRHTFVRPVGDLNGY